MLNMSEAREPGALPRMAYMNKIRLNQPRSHEMKLRKLD